MSSFAGLLPLLLLAVLGYFLLIRPTRRRAQEVRALQSALGVDSEVMLTSGIFGRVERIEDEQVLVEVSPGVVLTVHRGAIGKIVTPSAELDDELYDDAEDISPIDERPEPDAEADPDARGDN